MANDKDAFQRKARVRQYLAVSLVNLLGIAMGITVGWTSPMQPLLTSADNPVGTGPISEDTFALLGSIGFISSGISVVFWSQIAAWLGRKLSLLLVAAPYISSWIFTLVAQNAEILLLARFLTGFGVAGTVVIVPVFIVEIAQNDLRGLFGSFLGLSINVGVLISFALGPYLGYYGLAWLGLTVPIAFVLTFFWMPETPEFSWKKGKADKTEQSLLFYQGGDFVKTEQSISELKNVQEKEKQSTSFRSLFATKCRRKSLFLGVTIMVSLQGSGIFPIFNFAEKIFSMSGTSLTPNQSAVIIAFMQLISSGFCSVLIERIGRKPLLVGALMTMAGSLFLLGAHMYLEPNDSYSWIPLASLSVHVIAYSLGGGPVAFIMITELFPSAIRCLASSLMHLLTAALGFLSITVFPYMLDYINPHGCFLSYGVSCLLFSVFFYFQLPETKGKSEKEIMRALSNEPNISSETLAVAQPLEVDHHIVTLNKYIK